ncbi:glutaredoxin family protein, partial [Candidatus Bathyarchaeota archaeon]|nr:glutaredoxin family protein [Candidatus Bathyarchaeota archaeon]
MTQVEGENRGDVKLYALSTCGWCKKTKGLLNDLHAQYSYVDVDQLE